MSLAITVLSENGTLANGRPRLVASVFYVSSSSSFTREIVDLAKIGEAYDLLDDDTSAMVEIDPAGLLALKVEPHLDMINGHDFENYRSCVAEIERAQKAARVDGVRVMISPAV
jgi:hypothetical protein